MTYSEERWLPLLAPGQDAEFSPEKIFTCGQCFRWKQDGSQWRGVVRGRLLRLRLSGGEPQVLAPEEELAGLREYFDMERDYAKVRSRVAVCGHMERAAEFGRGIRILRQEPWETLCSFILSQCNNITRISGMVERLCREAGSPCKNDGGSFSFPTAARVAELGESRLRELGFGFRAPYVMAAAEAVASGELELDALRRVSTREALESLTKLPGVGVKVASCALLFGLGHFDAFPVDVWMRRALAESFPPDFTPDVFGDVAGIAQQYIFFYARSGKKPDKSGTE